MTGHFVIHEHEISHPLATLARHTQTHTDVFPAYAADKKWSGRLLPVLQMAQVCVCLRLI